MTRPIVFLTDYGLADEFVGVCRGVMLRIAPHSRILDLAHAIPRQDVLRGALTLGRATDYMPDDAVYVGVVDPGVGTERRSIAVLAESGAVLVGPDNGLLSLAWESLGGAEAAVEITAEHVMLLPVSRTFHGRDVFAPAGAHLATGMRLEELGPAISVDELRILELPGPMVAAGAIGLALALTDLQAEVVPRRAVLIPITLELLLTHRIVTLSSSAGRLDLLAEIPGLGVYRDLIAETEKLEISGRDPAAEPRAAHQVQSRA